jgi:hypothetical protein
MRKNFIKCKKAYFSHLLDVWLITKTWTKFGGHFFASSNANNYHQTSSSTKKRCCG